MVRFILKRTVFDAYAMDKRVWHSTIDIDVPALEKELTGGGCGESGWDIMTLVGAEVRVPEEES